jgi:hypothetical protein
VAEASHVELTAFRRRDRILASLPVRDVSAQAPRPGMHPILFFLVKYFDSISYFQTGIFFIESSNVF